MGMIWLVWSYYTGEILEIHIWSYFWWGRNLIFIWLIINYFDSSARYTKVNMLDYMWSYYTGKFLEIHINIQLIWWEMNFLMNFLMNFFNEIWM